MPKNLPRTLSEARVVELIRTHVRSAVRKALGSNLTHSLPVSSPLEIENPDAHNSALSLATGDGLTLDSGALIVHRDPNGGIGLSEDGLQITGGIPIRTETPVGVIDGGNAVFQLNELPQAGEVLVFCNGLLLEEDPAGDYERDGSDLTFASESIPEAGDRLRAVYLEGVGAAGEMPAGPVDGTNAVFTLSQPAKEGSVMLFHNGVFMARGGSDYELDEDQKTLTFSPGGVPETGDRLWSVYEIEEQE